MTGDPGTMLLLAGAGLLAGAVNAAAGGGTFLTFPVLIWAGLPPLVANTTNMVALLPANLTALPAFRPQLGALGRRCRMPLLAGLAGGGLGALLLLWLGNGVFSAAVPYLMGCATLLFWIAPRLRQAVAGPVTGTGDRPGAVPAVTIFVFAIYGGYFGAGLGQIMLAALILSGFSDLHQANALKNLVIFAITAVAVAVFATGGSVHWPYALVMMVTAALGGFLGGALSLAVPPRILRAGIIVFGLFLSLYYFVTGA